MKSKTFRKGNKMKHFLEKDAEIPCLFFQILPGVENPLLDFIN